MDLFEKFSPIQFTEPTAPCEIHERAVTRARKYLVAESALLEAIMEVDKFRVFEKFGFAHLTPYCVRKLGLSEEVAACFVRVARKSVAIPELKEALEDGRLTMTKAKTIAPVLNAANQEIWIEKASRLSKEKLERAIASAVPQPSKPEKAKPVSAERTRVEFELGNADMEMQNRAQDLVSQSLGRPATLADTQAELLKLYLKYKDPLQKADRSRERSIEQKVHARDRGECQAKLPDGTKCRATRWIHLHHLKPKSEGGPHTAENLLTLCASHHRQWHRRMGGA